MMRTTIPRWTTVLAGGLAVILGTSLVTAGGAGCIQVGGNEPLARVNLGPEPGEQPVDTSRVPPMSSMQEARVKLAEAYNRIGYLEHQVRDLEKDKAELKADLKAAKRERDVYKDRYEKATGKSD